MNPTNSFEDRVLRHALLVLAAAVLLLVTGQSRAELVIQITEGADRGIPVSVVPFGTSDAPDMPENLANIIRDNLTMSGDFEALEPASMLSLPSSGDDLSFRDWRMLGQEYVLVGEVEYREDRERYILSYELFDVSQQRRVIGSRASAVESELRTLAHHVSNRIYEAITGIEGIFNTRLAFVTRNQEDGETVYRLKVSDIDGHRDQVLLRSTQPILSPDWSPDRSELTYVSFEGGRPGIYRQEIRSGERERLTSFTGLNSAPSWSPDGRSLLMTLSKDGSAEIYRYVLDTGETERLTHHWSINTEASWAPDGERFAFTSDRSGRPQVYVQSRQDSEAQRVTFEGNYNARPRFGPDGEELFFIHGREGEYYLGALNLDSGEQRVFPRSRTEESPAVSPNGRLVMYVTDEGNARSLELTTVDGRAQFRLPVRHDGIRDPVWSPME